MRKKSIAFSKHKSEVIAKKPSPILTHLRHTLEPQLLQSSRGGRGSTGVVYTKKNERGTRTAPLSLERRKAFLQGKAHYIIGLVDASVSDFL